MTGEYLKERGRALENVFFAIRDQELLERLRESLEDKGICERLACVSGINDPHVLDQLIEQGVNAETLAAVVLIPLVLVAWADYVMDPNERQAILQGCEQAGLGTDDPAYHLLQSWLEQKPGPELQEQWRHYVAELHPKLNDSAREALKKVIVERGRKVAFAAGGILGLGNRISKAEQAVLSDVEERFD